MLASHVVRHAQQSLPRANEEPPPLPVGVMVTATLISLVSGAAAVTLFHRAAPLSSWPAAAALCFALLLVARRLVPSSGRMRRAALLTLSCLLFSYLLILGGESVPRPADRGALQFLLLLVSLLGVLAAALLVPVLIVVGALRSAGLNWPPRHAMRASTLPVGMAAATALLGILLFAAVRWASPARWRMFTLPAVALAIPLVLVPGWSWMYRRALSRRRVPAPASLAEGLARLHALTGFEFREVLCLAPEFSHGRVCQVVGRPVGSMLVMSGSIPAELQPDPLLALLAHEAAHVRLHHLRRKLAWGFVGGVAALAASIGLQMAVFPLVPRSLEFVGILSVLLPVVTLRGLYDTFVVRHHEAEADAFAVRVAGAPALLGALEALGGAGPSHTHVHDRWTTHGTWESRMRRILAAEKTQGTG